MIIIGLIWTDHLFNTGQTIGQIGLVLALSLRQVGDLNVREVIKIIECYKKIVMQMTLMLCVRVDLMVINKFSVSYEINGQNLTNNSSLLVFMEQLDYLFCYMRRW